MVSYLSIKGSGAWPTQGRNPATFPRCHGGRGTGHLKDVAPSLTQFRSAMVAIPKNFHPAEPGVDFEDEVHDVC
jgi:hypothetical protein